MTNDFRLTVNDAIFSYIIFFLKKHLKINKIKSIRFFIESIIFA
jgi:hypothetical protein